LIFHLLAGALSENGHRAEIERLPELAAASLTLQPCIAEIVERYAFMEQCVVVGRGLNYANAFEFAIKLMETCYVVAERFSGADFLHGPIAMIDRGFPVFVFAPPGAAPGPGGARRGGPRGGSAPCRAATDAARGATPPGALGARPCEALLTCAPRARSSRGVTPRVTRRRPSPS